LQLLLWWLGLPALGVIPHHHPCPLLYLQEPEEAGQWAEHLQVSHQDFPRKIHLVLAELAKNFAFIHFMCVNGFN
jgi:hypothetical protein